MSPFSALLGAIAAATQATSLLAPESAPPVSLPAPPGRIGYLTGGELAARCRESSIDAVAQCFSYLAAVHDSVRAYEAWLSIREFCIPAAIAQSDLRDILVRYVDEVPGAATGQAASVAIRAMKQAYPCPSASPTPETRSPAMPGVPF